MANICNTDYCIGSSTIETLVKFNEKLKTLSENEYDEIDLEELLKSFGIDNEDEDIRTCGEIIYYNLDLENNKLWITVTSNTRQELETQIDYLYLLYEGMTIRVEREGNLIYGGVLDDNTIDYILDELNLKKMYFLTELDKACDEDVKSFFGGRRIV